MPTYFERRQLVLPGDLLAEDSYVAGENTYVEVKNLFFMCWSSSV